jgi:hypothetical protein
VDDRGIVGCVDLSLHESTQAVRLAGYQIGLDPHHLVAERNRVRERDGQR